MGNKIRDWAIESTSVPYIGYNIERMRRDKGLSQKEMGKLLGTSQCGYSRYETDKVYPSYPMLMKMCEVFNTKLDFLIHHFNYKDLDGNVINLCSEEIWLLVSVGKDDIEIMNDFGVIVVLEKVPDGFRTWRTVDGDSVWAEIRYKNYDNPYNDKTSLYGFVRLGTPESDHKIK